MMMATSPSAKAQEVTIYLGPGWTWISLPGTDTLDFTTALGSFTPMAGDMIKSQWGNAIYRADGNWRGSISQFYPGYGYKYYSNRTVPVTLTFNVQQPAPQVVVTTSEPTDITANSATCGGNVASSDGNYVFVILRGICWSTNPNPIFNDNYIEAGNGLGSFTASMIELALGTTYYVRAFAVTPTGTFYGEEVSFSTDHEYVDLGLPSGNLWATCNIGSQAPEDYGDYFAWGETLPKNTYSWSSYQYCNGSISTITKYCNDPEYGYNGFTDTLTTLLPIDDAAAVYWGTDWHMPTEEEWEELYTFTTVTWTTQNGVNGRLFTASNGNSLFLPATGCFSGANHIDAGSSGYYWSSSLYTDNPSRAWKLSFDYGGLNMSGSTRWYGYAVRAVHSVAQNTPFVIDATANPAEGGEVSGGGNYQQGDECTLTATANDSYTFSNWTENDSVVSTDANYTFTVISDRTLVANFTLQSYIIDVLSSPSSGGNVSGNGSYNYGQSCTISTSANIGYTFSNWTENNEVVSTDAIYTFSVYFDRTLVANFSINVPIGAINGLFTINSNGDQVFFSQGNLQYRASTHTWRFASNQWDYVGTQTPDYNGYVGGTINGSDNQYISNSYSGWIDLYGWGTSGYAHGAICYHPYDTYSTNSAYYAYGDIIWDLDDYTGQADWGYNPIINGGNQENQWRTLSVSEWNYVFNTRSTTSGILYAKAKVNNVNGVILLPDDWNSCTYSLINTNNSAANYSSNTLTASQWTSLENAGAVFLPAAGYRGGTSINYVSYYGYYWSASAANSERSCNIKFSNGMLNANTMEERKLGLSVRLVRDVE